MLINCEDGKDIGQEEDKDEEREREGEIKVIIQSNQNKNYDFMIMTRHVFSKKKYNKSTTKAMSYTKP